MASLLDRLPRMSGVRTGLTPVIVNDERQARARGITRRRWNLVRSWHLDLLPSLALLEQGVLVDVGAHEGLWTRDVLEIAPGARVIACEPQADLAARVAERFAGDPRVTVERRAVADAEGTRELHLMDASVNASLHAPLPGMDELYEEGWGVQGTVQVETTTVDALVGDEPVGLLKVDVQGAEAEVLAGARRTLARTAAVMLEATFVNHYEGDATFPALHALMTEAGFALTGISEPARSPRGAMLTADACYVGLAHLDAYLQRR
jgi:FkbM family methyltransferase